jgi:outer membrane protein assembly factor BamB
MLPFLAIANLTSDPAPLPPYRRLNTVEVYTSAYEPDYTVGGDIFFTTSGNACLAFDLKTLRPRWRFRVPANERGAYVLAVGDTLFLSTESDIPSQRSHVIALDAKTGRERWRMERRGKGSAMAARNGLLYMSLSPGKLSAVEIARKKAKWTRALPSDPKREGDEVESLLVAETGIAVNAGNVTYGLSPTGAGRWRETASYLLGARLIGMGDTVWVPVNEGMVARSLKTGRALWRRETDNFSEFGGILDGKFVGLDNGYVRAYEPKTGRPLWAHKLGPGNTSGGRQYGAIFGNRLFVGGMERAGIYDAKGKALWTGKADTSHSAPCWTDGRNLVAFDGHRLLRYVHGAEPPIPATTAGRQALARKWVARFTEMDASDQARLIALKDDAFPALLAAFLEAGRAYDAVPEGKDSYPLYSRYQDLGRTLAKVTTKHRTTDLMKALDRRVKSASPLLLNLLAQHGDPQVTTPYFLRELEGKTTPDFEMYESNTFVARQFVANSSDPRAVAFMLKQLRDPEADEALRFEAFVNLPRTGGEEGRDAVRALRALRTPLPSLAERVLEGFLGAGEFGAKPKLVGEKTDAKGRTWGLLASGVIGSRGDLWLMEKVAGKWANPLFTGVSTEGVSRWAKDKPEPKIGGKTGAELVKADWVAILADNAEIRRDTDGDGLTDLVEKRLETDSQKADTDGDGDSDSLDPWPNAARSAETEEEKVLAAVFEARYFLDPSEGPALVYLPPNMKPFEMPGRAGVSIWATGDGKKWSRPLEQSYEQGVGFVRFQGSRTNPAPVRWSQDRQTAYVGISIYYGGLNGTGYEAVVRKFGGEWFVVSLRMTFIS